MACSARYSCTKPSRAYNATMERMAIVFFVSPSKPATTAAPMRMSTIVAVICSHKIWNAVRPPRSINSFAPYLVLFSLTCVEVNPVSEDDENSSSADFVSSVCQFIFFPFRNVFAGRVLKPDLLFYLDTIYTTGRVPKGGADHQIFGDVLRCDDAHQLSRVSNWQGRNARFLNSHQGDFHHFI